MTCGSQTGAKPLTVFRKVLHFPQRFGILSSREARPGAVSQDRVPGDRRSCGNVCNPFLYAWKSESIRYNLHDLASAVSAGASFCPEPGLALCRPGRGAPAGVVPPGARPKSPNDRPMTPLLAAIGHSVLPVPIPPARGDPAGNLPPGGTAKSAQ